MAVFNWPSVTLKGGSQAIPRTCPNCLKPATVEYRYAYVSPLYIITRTRYFQTFYYCSECEPLLEAYFKWSKWSGCLGFILYVGGFLGAIIGVTVLLGKGGALEMENKDAVVALAFVTAGLSIAAVWGLLRFLRGLVMNRHALKEGQALKAPAAYYTGNSFLTLGSAQIYKAIKPGWIKLLVQANPDGVDDATYQRIVGATKPSAPPAKPFAG